MDYKYKQALERAQKLQENSNGMILKKWLWGVFPELAESKEERTRKEILNVFKQLDEGTTICGRKYDYAKWIAWLEKQGENKPTENIEIGFCEGDKVVSDQNGKVYTVGTAYYVNEEDENICLHDTDGNHLWTNRNDLDKNYHVWTIADAKDGDVLVCESGWTCIFKTLVNDETFSSYCFMDNTKWFCEIGCECHTLKENSYNGKIYPADKEQRDLLFHKMKEAGYEWDSEKKELKKVEQKPDDNVEPKFKPGDWIVFNGLTLHIDEVVNGYYRTTSRGDGIRNSYDWDIDNAARLWTIEEARVGAVLVDEDNNIGIYVGKNDDLDWHSCIYLGCDNRLRGFSIGGYHNIKNTKPATKKQRDLLFQKMKEAGYEWDADKKELKKIEPKKLDVWNAEDEQNLNVVLSFIPDECLRRWLKDKLCYDTLDADKVIEWLTANVRLYGSLNFLYGSDCPQGDVEVESLIKSFKKDFGL